MKITQEKAFFYILLKNYLTTPSNYIPIWKFVGELFIEEFNTWYLMSYKCPTNGQMVFTKNPDLIERRKVRGKSGARYYEYRIAPNPSVEKIKDIEILDFYKKIKPLIKK